MFSCEHTYAHSLDQTWAQRPTYETLCPWLPRLSCEVVVVVVSFKAVG
jgi:hypothetical protein